MIPEQPPPPPPADYAGMFRRGEITPAQPSGTPAMTWDEIVRLYRRMHEQMGST